MGIVFFESFAGAMIMTCGSEDAAVLGICFLTGAISEQVGSAKCPEAWQYFFQASFKLTPYFG